MSAATEISIVVVTDEHYVIMLAALLKSIEINHSSTERLNIYIVEDGVSDKSKHCIQETITSGMIKLHWLTVTEAMPPGLELPVDRTSFPMIAYMRLFMPHFLPMGIQKAIFLDVDMIVLTDISRLWHMELGQYALAAVQDPLLLTFDNHWGGIKNYKELGFEPGTLYFNSGMMMINVAQWAEENIAQKVIDTVNLNKGYANYPDQYGLNIVLAGRWMKLDNRWNYFASGILPDPYIMHYTTRKPFYKSYNKNEAYRRLFYYYLNQTPWRNTRPVGELRRFAKKLGDVWKKMQKAF